MLYLVAVPIGNLEDITLRAQRVLKEADLIACEDTRRTGHLLELLGLPKKRLISLNEQTEEAKTPLILEELEAGANVAFVSDAGTPGISDPGFKIVRAAAAAGLPVTSVPGPCAAIVALSASGLPTDRFRFIGFLPAKAEAMRRSLEALVEAEETLIFYVPPHRLQNTVECCCEVFGPERQAVIARELTKVFEEFRRDTLKGLVETPVLEKGEVVMMIAGAPEEAPPEGEALESVVRELLNAGYSVSRAAKEAASRTGCRKAAAYQVALALSGGES